MTGRLISAVVLFLGSTVASVPASAQPLGTFRWQLQSYCNVLSLVVTQNGSVFTLDGFDDQCGAATRAPVTGLATANPNGTIEFGLTIVAAPGATPVHVAAAISLATLGGTWRDSAGASGNFVFTPGAETGGGPRPVSSVIPSAITLFPDGAFVARADGDGTNPAPGPGRRMMWYANRFAFRAGGVAADQWADANTGLYSAALGRNTIAKGDYSTALGQETTASGTGSFAAGSFAVAEGPYSIALGSNTQALGENSLAAGFQSVATGTAAVAIGNHNSAAGAGSVTLGTGAVTIEAASGSFVFGDGSTMAAVTSVGPNNFVVRAAGGAWFYTKNDLSTGAHLPENDSQWEQLSDVNAKEHFSELDDEELLGKIARMPVREWSYKAQGPSIRHIGPTAQDFHAAFRLGTDPLRIGTLDEAGVALAAARALEARTRIENDERVQEIDILEQVIDALKQELGTLSERLARLEAKQR